MSKKSNFLYPGTFMVYQTDNDGVNWIPALFSHRDQGAYFLVGETLEELVPIVTSGMAQGDSDPIRDLRVVGVNSTELYRLNDDQTAFVLIDPEGVLDGPDAEYFKFY